MGKVKILGSGVSVVTHQHAKKRVRTIVEDEDDDNEEHLMTALDSSVPNGNTDPAEPAEPTDPAEATEIPYPSMSEAEGIPKKQSREELMKKLVREDDLLVILINSTSIFYKMFEVLHGILVECNLTFSEQGMKIFSMNMISVALVHFLMDANKMPFYYIQPGHTFKVGINISKFLKSLNPIKYSSHLIIRINKNKPNKLLISTTTDIGIVINIAYTTLDLEDKRNDFEDADFNFTGVFPSKIFDRIVSDLACIAETLLIKTTRSGLKLISKGDTTDSEICILPSKDTSLNFEPKDRIRLFFNIQYLVLFSKAHPLANQVTLHLKNDYFMVVIYNIPGFGEMKFCLSPLTDSNDDVNNADDDDSSDEEEMSQPMKQEISQPMKQEITPEKPKKRKQVIIEPEDDEELEDGEFSEDGADLDALDDLEDQASFAGGDDDDEGDDF